MPECGKQLEADNFIKILFTKSRLSTVSCEQYILLIVHLLNSVELIAFDVIMTLNTFGLLTTKRFLKKNILDCLCSLSTLTKSQSG